LSVNRKLDQFLYKNINYTNFDLINENVDQTAVYIERISAKEYENKVLEKDILSLADKFKSKLQLLERFKTTMAVINNSYKYIQTFPQKNINQQRYEILKDLLSLDTKDEQDIGTLREKVLALRSNDPVDKKIKMHSRVIIETYLKLERIKKDIEKLDIQNNLNSLINKYFLTVKQIRSNYKLVITFTILLMLITVSLLIYYYYESIKKTLEANRFRKAVENSDNIVVLTDSEQKITYINDSFVKATGYTSDEVLGKTPSILKSGLQSETFYKKLNDTIYSGRKWNGEFINVDKKGRRRYEKASITPIFDSNGEIINFLAIKLDITDEVLNKQKLEENKQLLIHQTKMAALGEMLENIAHQWRQPLSTITTVASAIQIKKDMDMLNDDEFKKSTDSIISNAEYLSKTIDDFRNFFKKDKKLQKFDLYDAVMKAQNISSSKFKSKYVQQVSNLEKVDVIGLEGEMVQVILNLYSNAVDAFKEKDPEKNIIFTDLYIQGKNAVLTVRDTAGGIPEENLTRVFEPYFTTKHKSQGTGIGLYMTHEIVQKTFKGIIDVKNTFSLYNGKEYKGAEFTVIIPLCKED
jgi:PAS domain S-box-containing protein